MTIANEEVAVGGVLKDCGRARLEVRGWGWAERVGGALVGPRRNEPDFGWRGRGIRDFRCGARGASGELLDLMGLRDGFALV